MIPDMHPDLGMLLGSEHVTKSTQALYSTTGATTGRGPAVLGTNKRRI